MCCDGTWFTHINLPAADVEGARALGMRIEIVNEHPQAALPCHLHLDGKCSVYDAWRPTNCVKFECRLLEDLQVGKVALEDALGHVRAARGMADRIRAELGPAPGGLIGPRFMQQIDDGGIPGRARLTLSPGGQLDAVALNRYYVKVFEKKEATAKPGG